MNLKINDPIPATLQLFDNDETMHVRAIVRAADKTVLGTVTLSHIADGLYANTDLVTPATSFVSIQYEVFEDAGFTVPSELHSTALDVFGVNASPFTLAQIADRVWDESLSSHTLLNSAGRKLNESITPASFIPAGQQIEVEVEPVQTIIVEVEEA